MAANRRRLHRERTEVALGAGSRRELTVETAVAAPPAAPAKTLVEAGDFKTIFTAAEPWCVNDHTFVQGPDKMWHLFGITHPKPFDFAKDPGTRLAVLEAVWLPPA